MVLDMASDDYSETTAATMEADFRKLDPVHGEYGKVFDGVGAQLGDFDVVTCFGKLQLCWGRYIVSSFRLSLHWIL